MRECLKCRIVKPIPAYFGEDICVRCNLQKYDDIDAENGPSMLAEMSAQKTGYWNRQAADMVLYENYRYDRKEKKYKSLYDIYSDTARALIYDEYQVRKY